MSGRASGVFWSVVTIVALCLFVGLPTIRSDNYFLGDDFGLVRHLHDLPFQRLLSYFGSDWTEGAYGAQLDELRPFLAFSYWSDAHLFGATGAAGYHATNVVLHALNALLVLAIARVVAPGHTAFSVLAAALFAVMPSQAEPIAWISGRVDSLAALFYLGAFLCFVRFRSLQRARWLVATLVVFACGLFTKQSLVTFPVLAVAYDLFGPVATRARDGRVFSRLAHHVPLFVLLALYLLLRYQLFGNAVREDSLSVSAVMEFVFIRQYFYLMQLLPTGTAFPLLATGVTIGVLALSAIWLRERRESSQPAIERVMFFGAVWYVITILPMVVTYPSARHLYVTSAGLAIALASLVLPGRLNAERERNIARLLVAGVLIVLNATALTVRNERWIRSGIESGQLVASIPRTLETVPPGSVVMMDVPAMREGVWLWGFALPFALQKPFQAQNLYDQFQIVEHPRVYCCRDQWWSAKEKGLLTLMNSPAPTRVSYIKPAVAQAGTPLLTTRAIDGTELQQRIEQASGMPVAGLSTKLTYQQAQQIAGILMK